ncbi:MAG: hypothetical protein AB7U45_03830 [Desulfamplus sp.]
MSVLFSIVVFILTSVFVGFICKAFLEHTDKINIIITAIAVGSTMFLVGSFFYYQDKQTELLEIIAEPIITKRLVEENYSKRYNYKRKKDSSKRYSSMDD